MARTLTRTDVLVLDGRHSWSRYAHDLWRQRSLAYYLGVRDLKVRYRQTLLGVGWALVQPLTTTLVFAMLFGEVGGTPSEGVPYALFAFAGLLPWFFFASTVSRSAESLVASSNLVSRAYFPRLLVPVATFVPAGTDLLLSLVALLVWAGASGSIAATHLLLLPLAVVACIVASLGPGLLLAALNVRFRDVRHALPFALQLGLLATPVAYPASLLPGKWQLVAALNPVVFSVDLFRWSTLGVGDPWGNVSLASATTSVLLLIAGIAVFRRLEPTFADVI